MPSYKLFGIRVTPSKAWEVIGETSNGLRVQIALFPTRTSAVAFIQGIRFGETGDADPIKYPNTFSVDRNDMATMHEKKYHT